MSFDQLFDIENWWPREVGETLEIDGDIELEEISDTYRRTRCETRAKEEVAEDLRKAGKVGFKIIRDREGVEKMVCLVTKSSIHIFRPEVELDMNLLRSLLSTKRIQFFLTDGPYDGSFLDFLKVKVGENFIDLPTLDLHLVLEQELENKNRMCNQVDLRYIFETLRPKVLSIQGLVRKWLRIDTDLRLKPYERHAIECGLLNRASANAIKKKAALIRQLGLAMQEEQIRIFNAPSLNIYSMARRADNDIKERYDRQEDNSYRRLCQYLSQCPADELGDMGRP